MLKSLTVNPRHYRVIFNASHLRLVDFELGVPLNQSQMCRCPDVFKDHLLTKWWDLNLTNLLTYDFSLPEFPRRQKTHQDWIIQDRIGSNPRTSDPGSQKLENQSVV